MDGNLYQPLRPSEFRVLTLHRLNPHDCRIYCTLTTEIAPYHPPYVALSYVWGDARDVVEIRVNDRPLAITRNLFFALYHLRRLDSPVSLWVDAICIDQNNVAERNEQVRFMQEIYRRAEGCIAWLGVCYDDSDLAMDLLKAWAIPSQQNGNMQGVLSRIRDPFNQRAWRAVQGLLKRPFWERVWVLQEITFSRDVLVRCGSKEVSWEDLGWVVQNWAQLYHPANSQFLTNEDLRLVSLTKTSQVARMCLLRLSQVSGERNTSFDTITHSSASYATDARDKVYALLGFSEISVLGIRPDYLRPVETVYTEFFQAYLVQDRRLDLLARMAGIGWQPTEPTISLPSWVPDLRGEANENRNPITGHFAAGGSGPARANIAHDSLTLTIQGVFVDTLTVTDASGYDVGVNKTAIIPRWLEMAMGTEHQHPAGVTQLQAFFRTIVADSTTFRDGQPSSNSDNDQRTFFDLAAGMLWNLYPSPQPQEERLEILRRKHDITPVEEQLLAGVNDYVRALSLWSLDFPRPASRTTLLYQFTGAPGSNTWIDWEDDADIFRGRRCSNDFMSKTVHLCTNRSFFVTQRGFLGLGPKLCRPGDMVFVSPGCHIPLILRGDPAGHFILVGDAFVYGIMMGEVVDQLTEGLMVNVVLK